MKKKGRDPLFFLSVYLIWQLIMTLLLLAMSAGLYFMTHMAGLTVGIFALIFMVSSLILYLVCRLRLGRGLRLFSHAFESLQARAMDEISIAVAIIDTKGNMLWENRAFTKLIGPNEFREIQKIFPDLTGEALSRLKGSDIIHSSFGGRQYLLELNAYFMTPGEDAVNAPGKDPGHAIVRDPGDAIVRDPANANAYDPRNFNADDNVNDMIYIAAIDETDLLKYRKLSEDIKACEGLIYLDNYDEVFDSVEEVRRSLLSALVDRRISGYIAKFGGVVKKLEKDKYFFFMKNADLERMIEDHFSLLEEVKTVNVGSRMKNFVTLSLSIGRDGTDFKENDLFARTAMDFAMGRGGDQAVLKEGENVVFYGGKTEAREKRPRIKARVKADALVELLNTCDTVLVMGHKDPDVDSLGAAMGFYRIALSFGKKCHVVISKPTRSLSPLYNLFKESGDYPEDLFISGKESYEKLNDKTLVVVVDVNRPSRTEEPGLLSKVKNIAIVDHHRVSSDVMENAALTYIEPYASSACELVAEIIEYLDSKVSLSPMEADAMYSGIIVDTQNFSDRTGVRTFETAAYLKRAGANLTLVRKIMRDSINDYRAKAAAIERAEIYRGAFAISECDASKADSPIVIGAQAANSLLEIDGIKATFVLTAYDGKIYISARSIDEVNVQLMMEKLGGGGHMTIAGAQLTDKTIDEAKNEIKSIIDEWTEGNAKRSQGNQP